MLKISARPLAIPDVMIVTARRFGDPRGFFVETYNRREFEAVGISCAFVQDNVALSARRGTVRGLHFQAPPRAQAKLVSVVSGAIFDVCVDIRAASPTYGRWCAVTLRADASDMLFVPHGFAHGYCTLEDNTQVAYKVDDYYAPELERGLMWDDPGLAIGWPVGAREAILSEKDAHFPPFADFVSPFGEGHAP